MSRQLRPGPLVIATHNQGKFEEMADLLRGRNLELVSAGDLDLPIPDETEDSFVGNATIKALAAARRADMPALADDSGLCVDALGGAPGVHTADWAETPAGRDFSMAMSRVHAELLDARAPTPWLAGFHCALALAWPDGHVEAVEGWVRGNIVWPMRGSLGHGYDPIFVPAGHDRTFAEMDRWAKNRMSHRAAAMAQLERRCFT
jgi:XTP/dITP diphosphohydrolase